MDYPEGFRVAGIADGETLSHLRGACFSQGWSAQEFTTLLHSPGVFCLLAPEASGYILLRVVADECELLTVAVPAPFRRQGLGSQLVHLATEYAKRAGAASMFLEVSVTNVSARALYAKLGFSQIGIRPGYYSNAQGPVDAVTLRLDL